MTDWPAFIRANTRLMAPPLVPEILLHLAEESLPIWRRTEEELERFNVPPPYWAFAWAGGQALARYALDNPHLFAGRAVIEIGTGSGLAAIAAAKAGAARVLAADIDHVAIVAARLNATTNNVTIDTTTDELLGDAPSPADVLLIADVFYERPLAEAVLAFAEKAAAAGALILVGDPSRSYFPTDRFDKRIEYRVPVTRELEDTEIKKTAVWSLRTTATTAN